MSGIAFFPLRIDISRLQSGDRVIVGSVRHDPLLRPLYLATITQNLLDGGSSSLIGATLYRDSGRTIGPATFDLDGKAFHRPSPLDSYYDLGIVGIEQGGPCEPWDTLDRFIASAPIGPILITIIRADDQQQAELHGLQVKNYPITLHQLEALTRLFGIDTICDSQQPGQPDFCSSKPRRTHLHAYELTIDSVWGRNPHPNDLDHIARACKIGHSTHVARSA